MIFDIWRRNMGCGVNKDGKGMFYWENGYKTKRVDFRKCYYLVIFDTELDYKLVIIKNKNLNKLINSGFDQ